MSDMRQTEGNTVCELSFIAGVIIAVIIALVWGTA